MIQSNKQVCIDRDNFSLISQGKGIVYLSELFVVGSRDRSRPNDFNDNFQICGVDAEMVIDGANVNGKNKNN